MAYRNLSEFIARLEERRLLRRVRAEVSAELEIAEIADRLSKADGPAVLFEKVAGSLFPVLVNAFGSREKMGLALEIPDPDEPARRIRELLAPPSSPRLVDKLRMLPQLFSASRFLPRVVGHGPCQEFVIQPTPGGPPFLPLDTLPVLKCWPGDGGRFITLPLVITRDPENGIQNTGMYRMQVYDGATTGMHWHPHKDGHRHYLKYERAGKRMEAAVALGGDPATLYAATAPLPPDVDENIFAGFLRRAPVDLVRARTVDLLVPAQAEFVLEGYLEPGERRAEGPFGDHTGFYSPVGPFPVFHVTCLTHSRGAIYPATVVGKPPMEDCFMAKATERIFLPLMQLVVPEIVDINLPIEGVFHNCALVSIRKTYPGQGKKVIHALWGMGQMMNTKFILVVEHDTDVQDLGATAWRVFNNTDPKRDLIFSEGPLDELDHSSPHARYGAKMGIDATRKGTEEGMPRPWPDEITRDPAVRERVARRWKEYGLA